MFLNFNVSSCEFVSWKMECGWNENEGSCPSVCLVARGGEGKESACWPFGSGLCLRLPRGPSPRSLESRPFLCSCYQTRTQVLEAFSSWEQKGCEESQELPGLRRARGGEGLRGQSWASGKAAGERDPGLPEGKVGETMDVKGVGITES